MNKVVSKSGIVLKLSPKKLRLHHALKQGVHEYNVDEYADSVGSYSWNKEKLQKNARVLYAVHCKLESEVSIEKTEAINWS